MKHPATLALFDYWNGLRGDRAAPERSDIDPAAIRNVLADTFMIEVDFRPTTRRLTFFVRLSGTRIDALFGHDLKGSNFLGLWFPEDRPSIADLAQAVLDDARPAVAGALASPLGRAPLGLELLLLPLRHQGKTHSRLLGALSPVAVPPWFGILPVETLRLTTQRIVDVPALPAIERRALAPSARALKRYPSERRGHLTVHDGGRSADAKRTSVG